MSNDGEKIFVDASQPAMLRYEDRQVDCKTLQEAVLVWMRLPEDEREKATIRVSDGTIYDANEIDRLYIAPGTAHDD
jgi:hypothetical protein